MTPENLTMATSYGRYQRTLSSAYWGNTWSLENNYTITAEAAATLHNGVTEMYGTIWDAMHDGYVTLTQAIERPYLNIPQPVKGVATQVQCTSFPKSQLSINQSLESETLGFIRPIPVSIGNATGSESTSTVNLTWIDMGDTADTNKSIGVLVTLPQAFQSQSGVDPATDPTLRQDYAMCLCAVVARWAPVNMGWDANMTHIISSNLTKGHLSKLGEIWDDDSHADEYGASRPIHVGVDWADMLNVGGRLVEAHSGEVINASSIEALFWRHMSQYSPAGDDAPVWSMNSSDYSGEVQVQADNKKWAGYAVESLAARVLSLVFTDGISRAADWAGYDVFYNSSQPPSGYHISVDVKRYGWGYGLSGLTIFAICVLFIHAAMVIVYTGYSVYLAVRGRHRPYRMLADVGELVVMSLGSRPTPKLSTGEDSPWTIAMSVKEDKDHRAELTACDNASSLSRAVRGYWRVNSGEVSTRSGTLRQRHQTADQPLNTAQAYLEPNL
ncbi:hypothetical protein PG993_007102 [Apiospora rasikravindrae]|uniref:Uncharacterized protein n=1 Tax=Apiospora rasikravindrae TaxID=990691 RepID=A0ABR1SXY3_9PEZI